MCYYPVPAGWREVTARYVAMAGAVATGKTHYLAVLGGRVLRESAEGPGGQSFLINPEEQGPLRDYQQHLDEGREIPGTKEGDPLPRDPIIARLGSSGAVVLVDVPGEAIGKPKADDLPEYLDMFSRADRVVFLFDPTAIQSVRTRLRNLIPQRGLGVGMEDKYKPELVLRNALELIRRGGGNPELAVGISKVDALWALSRHQDRANPVVAALRNPSSRLLREPVNPESWEDDLDAVDAEARSLLHLLGASNLVYMVRDSNLRAKYFAVSALGHPTDDAGLNDHGIAPFRVLDPIRSLIEEVRR
jgi:hypothetical protein